MPYNYLNIEDTMPYNYLKIEDTMPYNYLKIEDTMPYNYLKKTLFKKSVKILIGIIRKLKDRQHNGQPEFTSSF